MLPVICSIGPVTIYTFGFVLAVGFFLFSFLAWRRLKNLGLEEEKIVDFILSFAVFGFLLARLGFILSNWADFGGDFSRWFLLGRYPGLSFWGMILGGALVLVRFAKKNRWAFWRVADELTFAFMPLVVLVYLGYFFGGSCPGLPTSAPWGIFFPGDLIRRQPVALFGVIGFFLIWLFLLRIERLWRTWKWYKSGTEGFIGLAFLALAFGLTFLLAFWEENRLYYLWPKRVISLLGLLAVGLVFYRRSGLKPKKLK